MAGFPDRLAPGSPYPLGATWDGLGTNFAVFSAHAERIDLCLFDPSGKRQIAQFMLPEFTDEVWHGYLPNAQLGVLYGYRAYGPYEPQQGLPLQPAQAAARSICAAHCRRPEMVGCPVRISRQLAARRPFLRSPRQRARHREGASSPTKASTGPTTARRISPWSDTVIYEAHLRGLTMLCDDIRQNERGTFAALADPKIIDHLRRLGITAVELLPIHAFVQDRHLLQKGLRNYWGYNTLGFFAVEPRYLSENSAHEMRVAVRRLHAAGIEVILDVVYNHTGEGSEMGPTLSFRGLDNSSYYRLLPDNPRHCINDTGTGNTLNLSNARVLQMVMDSLRYWVTQFHVDGFRFDLGVTLGREPQGFDPGAAFFDALRQDPILSRVKLISEPWDIGPGGYQLGHHPPGFAEWNDRYPRRHPPLLARRRRTARRVRGAHRRHRATCSIAARAAPGPSVNYAASHDGYTLADVVSYDREAQRGQRRGQPRRPRATITPANWGVEGPTDDPASSRRARGCSARARDRAFSHGTPMLLAGDEFGRRSAATTMPTARTTKSRGSTGSRPKRRKRKS